jgi:hypothetical protein
MTVFRVKCPSGVFTEGVWTDKLQIPQVWRDGFNVRFFVDDGEIVQEEVTEERYRYLLDE